MNTSADLLKELRIDRKAPPPAPPSRRGLWITLGVVVVLLALAAAGWAVLGKTGSHDVDMATRTIKACKAALPLLQRAMALDTRAGVKKDIERLERRLKPKAAEKAQAL